MNKIRQYQTVTQIKPKYKQLVHPFHKSGPLKIKFINEEITLQYNDIGLWEFPTKKTGGGQAVTHVVDFKFDL